MNQDDSCTNIKDEPNESNRFMNRSEKCTKIIPEPNLYDNSLHIHVQI